MAEKIKLGTSGNWGVKDGGVLGFNDENGVFKAIELASSRSSGATYVGEDGLIKDAEVGVPRIDWTNGVGELLLEPERINIVEYSEDGTEWDAINTTVSLTTDSTSPSGQSSVYKVNDDATDAQHRVDVRPSVTSGTEYTLSAFVKKPSDSDIDFVYLIFATNFSTARFYFNIAEGTSLDAGGTIENYGNGWYRLSASATANSSGNGIFGVNLTDGDGNNTYSGTGNGSMFVWGIQVERNASYPTSYIRNDGNVAGVTRIADAVTGNSSLGQVINSSEGVLYFEGSALVNGADGRITLSDGSISNRVSIEWDALANTIKGFMGSNVVQTSDYNQTNTLKIALHYKVNDFKMFINGFYVAQDTNVSAQINLNTLSFDNATGSNDFYGRIRELKVYDTALTDAELTTLTTI